MKKYKLGDASFGCLEDKQIFMLQGVILTLQYFSKNNRLSESDNQLNKLQISNIKRVIKDIEKSKLYNPEITSDPAWHPILYTKHFIEWLDMYFDRTDNKFQYTSKLDGEEFTQERVYKLYKDAINESPFKLKIEIL